MRWVFFVAIKHNPHVQIRKLQGSISNSTIEGDLEGKKMMFTKSFKNFNEGNKSQKYGKVS
jgi:hypothetical protein